MASTNALRDLTSLVADNRGKLWRIVRITYPGDVTIDDDAMQVALKLKEDFVTTPLYLFAISSMKPEIFVLYKVESRFECHAIKSRAGVVQHASIAGKYSTDKSVLDIAEAIVQEGAVHIKI